jgi:hypothetical protein
VRVLLKRYATLSMMYRNEGVLESTVPFFVNDLLSFNIYDWSGSILLPVTLSAESHLFGTDYTLTPQPGLNGRVLPYYRGWSKFKNSLRTSLILSSARLLGGCSAHNAVSSSQYLLYVEGIQISWCIHVDPRKTTTVMPS